MNHPIKIKICGLTSPAEAAYVNEIQADFAGMVLFFPKSKRNIRLEQAKEIIAALDASIKKVAVTVSPSMEQIREIAEAEFDFIQIHGAVPDGYLQMADASFQGQAAAEQELQQRDASSMTNVLPVLKAFNVRDMDLYQTLQGHPSIAGYVFDAQTPGSGKTFDWNLVDKLPRDGKLLLLAGGLHPGNVAEAIRALHPDGVDVSSGVEYEDRPGKDPEKIWRFAEAVRNSYPGKQ